MPGYTSSEIEVIIAANYSTSTLNAIGSLFTIITFLIFKDARNGATSLVFYLALSDFCTAISISIIALFASLDDTPCQIQATLLMFGICASMMWGLAIGIYMFLALYKNVELETLDRYRYVFHVLAWGYAFTAAISPLVRGAYGSMFPGHRFSWCWIKDPRSFFRLMMYGPDTVIFFALIILYGLTRHKLRTRQGNMANAICAKMSMYLLVYVFINFFAIVNRFQNFISPHTYIFPLLALQFFTQPLQGFLNAIAYVWNEPAFIEQYKQMFARWTGRRRKLASIQGNENDKLLQQIFYDEVID